MSDENHQEIDGMEKPSRSVRETIMLTNLRSKLRLVSREAGTITRSDAREETRTFAAGLREEADASIARIEGMLQ